MRTAVLRVRRRIGIRASPCSCRENSERSFALASDHRRSMVPLSALPDRGIYGSTRRLSAWVPARCGSHQPTTVSLLRLSRRRRQGWARHRVTTSASASVAAPILKWSATGVPVFDRLATLGPGSQSASLAAQLIAASLFFAYALKLVADSWMKSMNKSMDPYDIRLSGGRKMDLKSVLVHSLVPVVSTVRCLDSAVLPCR